ncbi:hypothetical protein IIA29_11075, partial [candidate division KSB1 bacterium]|nr:hypothetical protein [candidate division KSB1 bacterium]
MGKEARRYPFWQVAPQIVILGAGASVAAFPAGDKNGRTLPLMNDFTQILNLGPLFEEYEIEYVGRNFEEIYDEIHSAPGKKRLVQAVNRVVEEYFSEFQI